MAVLGTMLRRPSIIRIVCYNSKNGPHPWPAPKQQHPTRRTLFQPAQPPAATVETAMAPTTNNENGMYCIPRHHRLKVITAEDAASLVHDFDTVTCSGFVSQGAPEAVLQALGRRYQTTGHPHSLTLLFGGGPGDWQSRGLNHLGQTTTPTTTAGTTTTTTTTEAAAATVDGQNDATNDQKKNETTIPSPPPPPMLFRTIGSHYGQVPKVAQLALDEVTEAWALPLGSICRMIRAQATHAPGHLTNVGLGTYVDPSLGGAALNERARKSSLDLVTKLTVRGESLLLYKALPIQVAIIRGTTADAQGNISLEHESLMTDQRVMAAAAKNSGGVVIAQVKRLAAAGSLPPRSVHVPGAMVDAIVVVAANDEAELHPMSYQETLVNPAYTGTIKCPHDEVQRLKLDERKVIARRAFFHLKPDAVVNLGIGLPEGVAAVAEEEGMLAHVTLTTEPGVFGGLPVGGHNFGPAVNPSAQIEMNEMFDFYNGGGLDMSFLGAAQIGRNGDVNVSRMAKNIITGPGGFIDISQTTKNICFLSTLTAKGLELKLPGDGTLQVTQEGRVKKFVQQVLETTFSGDEAVRRGQKVFYITERAVFRRTATYDTLELLEVAPGVDLQRDVIDQMEFAPIVSENLKTMDARIFGVERMDVLAALFGSLADRCVYYEMDHVIFIDLFGVNISTEKDINWFFNAVRAILSPICQAKGPVDAVVNYNGFSLAKGLEDKYSEGINKLAKDFYKSVKRFSGKAFYRKKLGKRLQIGEWDSSELFDEFDVDKNGLISVEELRHGMKHNFHMHLTPSQLKEFQGTNGMLDRQRFAAAVEGLFPR